MKKSIYIKVTLLSLTVMLSFSSCLKDPRYVNFAAVGTLIELPLAEPNNAGTGGVFQSLTYSVSTQPVDTLIVAVNVASPNPFTTPLSVTLSVTDQTTLNAYNTANGTNYLPLPSSDFTVVGGLTVTVPANTRLAYLKVAINAAAIGVANSGVYVLPVSIASASGQPIAQPYKGLLYNVNTTP